VSTIKGWPLAFLIASVVSFVAWLYWTAAATYTLAGSDVTASAANGYCHTPAGQLDQTLYPLSARVCASAAEVEGNKATALIIALVLVVIAGIIMSRRRSAAATG
jgi:hypothetical protein